MPNANDDVDLFYFESDRMTKPMHTETCVDETAPIGVRRYEKQKVWDPVEKPPRIAGDPAKPMFDNIDPLGD